MAASAIGQSTSSASLGEILEKILDKGVVIAGDISIAIADVELLTIRIRLIVASIDKAEQMGIDWWKNDPALSIKAKKKLNERNRREEEKLEKRNEQLMKRIEMLENKLL